MKALECREKAAIAAAAARAVVDKAKTEDRPLTDEEMGQIEQHTAEAQRWEKQAERMESLEGLEGRLAAPKPAAVPPQMGAPEGEHIEVVAPKLFRFGKLRAFKGPKADENAYRAGKWLMATILGDERAQRWCKDHGVEVRVQTEGINTAGGFIVPDTMEDAIIDMREEYGAARRNLRMHPMTTDHVVIPRRTGGVTAYFVGETTEITASDKSWNQVELTAKKLGALTRMSTDLGEDAIINVADDLAQEMAYAFAVKEDQCVIDGDGTSTYGGMTGIRVKMIDGNHVGSYVDWTSSCDNWSEITDAKLLEVAAALPLYARRNAKWHCSPTCKTSVFDRLIRAAGGATMREVVDGTYRAAYMGYSIEEWAALPSDDTSAALNNKIMLFFGDLRMAATFGTRRGITIRVSDQRYLEYDQLGIQATERFCAVVHDIGGSTATDRGPVVGGLGGT